MVDNIFVNAIKKAKRHVPVFSLVKNKDRRKGQTQKAISQRGLGRGLFQKVINLKLSIPNIFLMYKIDNLHKHFPPYCVAKNLILLVSSKQTICSLNTNALFLNVAIFFVFLDHHRLFALFVSNQLCCEMYTDSDITPMKKQRCVEQNVVVILGLSVFKQQHT